MKKHILIPLAVIFLSVIGCSKPEDGGKDNPQPPAPPQEQITIPSTVDVTPVVPPEGGDSKITFTAASAWTASVISTKADSWVDVNPKSGNPGPAEIKITTTPNDTYVERNATIRINCGGQTKDVVLTQKQVDNITVTTDKVELGAEGGSFTVELKSNIDFSYEIKGDWIKYVSTKAYTDKTLTFSAEPNDDLQMREGSVTIKGGGFSETIKVYQNGEEPTFVISQKEYEVEAAGGTVEVSVTSNIGYHATSNADWIHAVETKTIQTKSLWFVVDANTSTEPRSGVIVICNDNEVCIPVTVKQAGGKSTLSISPSSLEFGYDGGENQVAVTSNADWTAECSADWCFVSPSSESGDCTVKVMVNANREEKFRSATVTFKTKESNKTLTISQRPFESVFEVSPRTHTADAAGGTVTVTVTSNIGYHATSSVDWIQELGTKANQGGTHIFRIEENKSIQKRTGAIVFCNDENVCVPVEIEQEGAAATISVSSSIVEFSSSSGEKTVEITSNAEWTVSQKPQWCTLSPSSATGSTSVRVSVTENGNTVPREGKIVFSAGNAIAELSVQQQAGEPELEVGDTELSFSGSGGVASFSILSNTDWVVNTGVLWLKASAKEGTGNATVTLTAERNEKTEARTAQVTVKTKDGKISRTITVKQAEGKSTLSISPSSLEFGYEGGENQVAVTSNADWTAECTADWCFVSPSSESGDCTVKVMVNANREEKFRSATVTFKTKESSKTLTILQNPFETVFEVSPRTHTADAAGGTVTVTVISNIGYHASPSVDWIQELGTKANQGGTHIFRIEENKSIQKRTGAIVFCNDENVCVPVEIEQEGAAATISVSSSILEFSSSSGEKTVEITSNAEWTVSQKPKWCTLSPSSATGSTSVRVSVTENGNTVSREGKIVFSAGSAIAELSVQQQAGEPKLEVSDTELSFSGSGGVASFSIISNADWVVNTGVLWLKASAEEGTGNATVTLTAERNEKTEARTAQVTVRTKDGIIRKSITVSQAAGEPYLELNVYSLNFSPQEGRAEVSVSSNASWNVTSSDSWCTVEKNTTANSVSVFIKANDSGKSRSAQITVRTDKGGLEKTVTVSQSTPEDNEGFDDDGEIIWD